MVRPSIDTEVILAAASDIAAERGYTAIRMSDVAERARVAKGVLYLRFADKEALLRAIIAREVSLASQVSRTRVTDDPRGGLLSQQYRHSLAALHSRRALVRLYAEPAPLSMAPPASDRAQRRELMGEQYIRQMHAAGMIREGLDISALAANISLWGGALFQRAPHDDIDALILNMADLIARAVDADIDDTSPGKRCFDDFAKALAFDGTEAS